MLSEFLGNGNCVWGHAPAVQAGNALRGQGEIGGFRFPPLFPLTPSPLETSRDTLHPGTGVTTRTNRPAGRVRGLGLRGIRRFKAACPESGFASLPDSCSFIASRFGVTGGYVGLPIRETRIGALSSACGRRARFANAQALLAISDFRHAESRTAGAWLQSQTCLRGIPPQTPFSASRLWVDIFL